MSKKEKLVKRFLSKPNDFTFSELVNLLHYFGYTELKMGKTSASRAAFFNETTKHIIRLHKPHPVEILKKYQIDILIEELRREELL